MDFEVFKSGFGTWGVRVKGDEIDAALGGLASLSSTLPSLTDDYVIEQDAQDAADKWAASYAA
jgi:hypothetical protein